MFRWLLTLCSASFLYLQLTSRSFHLDSLPSSQKANSSSHKHASLLTPSLISGIPTVLLNHVGHGSLFLSSHIQSQRPASYFSRECQHPFLWLVTPLPYTGFKSITIPSPAGLLFLNFTPDTTTGLTIYTSCGPYYVFPTHTPSMRTHYLWNEVSTTESFRTQTGPCLLFQPTRHSSPGLGLDGFPWV